MKTFIISLASALLFAGQWLSPAAAAPSSAVNCGTTYIVQNKDTLQKIADLCGTTVDNLVYLNPEIANPNLINPGYELRVSGIPPKALRVTYKVTFSGKYKVQAGDTFLDIANMYGITIWDILQANPELNFFSKLTEGMEIQIPGGKKVKSVTLFKDNSYVQYYPNARVDLSTTLAKPGDDVTVSVSGFPPGAYIDYHVRILGKNYYAIYDGVIDENGNSSFSFEVPFFTLNKDVWSIYVTTTSQKEPISANSPQLVIQY